MTEIKYEITQELGGVVREQEWLDTRTESDFMERCGSEI